MDVHADNVDIGVDVDIKVEGVVDLDVYVCIELDVHVAIQADIDVKVGVGITAAAPIAATAAVMSMLHRMSGSAEGPPAPSDSMYQ